MTNKACLFGAVAALALAACGKKETAPAAESAKSAAPTSAPAAETPPPTEEMKVDLPAGFPKMTAHYKAVYKASMADLGEREMTMEVAGARKYRFDMPHFNAARAEAGDRVVGVFDDAQNRLIMYVEGESAKKVGLVMPQEQNILESFLSWSADKGTPPTKTGSDKIAGLDCDVWETAGESGETPNEACITRDGILLRAGDKGAATPQLLAVSVDKGARPASSFALPADYEVVDMAPCQKLMQDAMAAAQSGKAPDMAAMQRCQEIGEKAGEIFGN